jgi:hypothetical protein
VVTNLIRVWCLIMSNPRKTRREPPLEVTTQVRVVEQKETSIQREACYIIQRAKNRDSRIVRFNQLVFFSTTTGDAWMLDPEDQLACCLALDGVEQPYLLAETTTTFAIEWPMEYHIEGDAFVVTEKSGRVRTILGYPTGEIELRSN